MTAWRVYHKGKGKHKEDWYERFEDVPEPRRRVLKESMFSETYTYFNNEKERTEDMRYDPLNLKRCLRLMPHDADSGGFFVCVLTKTLDKDEGIIQDEVYSMDAWNNPNVRQKNILDDLKDFVEEYEDNLKKYEEEKQIPKNKSS